MKEVIELLRIARKRLDIEGLSAGTQQDMISEAGMFIASAIAKLLRNKPRWETPEQWEKRTGKAWQDNWAVYIGIENGNAVDKAVLFYREAKKVMNTGWRYSFGDRELHKVVYIACATEAGPPPDDWRPE